MWFWFTVGHIRLDRIGSDQTRPPPPALLFLQRGPSHSLRDMHSHCAAAADKKSVKFSIKMHASCIGHRGAPCWTTVDLN